MSGKAFLQLHEVIRRDLKDAWSVFRDALVGNSRIACDVVKDSRGRKGTAWLNEEVDEVVKEKRRR